MANSEAAALHAALETTWERLAGVFDRARFDHAPGLRVSVFPGVPIPQCNGPWVVDDSAAAAEALPDAIAAADDAGERPWVQTRSGQELTHAAARELGFTHAEVVPGMVLRPGELVAAEAPVEISLIDENEIDATNAILAEAFEAPKAFFEIFSASLIRLPELRWYVGRASGAIVSTSVGFTHSGATGVFNVATPPAQRGRGYGAALTAHAAREGFDAGAAFVFLQSSESGHGVYRRLGFRDVEEYTLLTRPFHA